MKEPAVLNDMGRRSVPDDYRVRGLLLKLFFAICVLPGGWSSQHCIPRRYNTSSSRVEGILNVHIVPHTHDDAGWLKTVDQYFYGSKTPIQLAGVQYILDSVTHYLGHNPDRKFVYGEMAFFARWWEQQTEEVRDRVVQLVEDGQLDFVNGGWVQHDEAACHYVAMIDQTTRGHQFLNRTFGKIPRIGWQIDPFGHSSTHASLMSGALGFDALFFGRSDYQDLEARMQKQQLELLWRGSKSYGSPADIFTGSFASGNYGPPPGFNWDWGQADDPIMDNVCLSEHNVAARLDDFVQQCRVLANVTRGNDIMLTMGTDFTYSNAHIWFSNLDKLIHYANLDGRVNAFYSTPAIYAAAKNSYNASWPVKEDDFFPYADCPTCYWTGYFTSRPTSKAYIRGATSYLQAARQLEFLHRHRGGRLDEPLGHRRRHLGPSTDTLEEAVALTQHHDSITGTEKQHVANDYHKRVAKGLAEAQEVVLEALGELIYPTSEEGVPVDKEVGGPQLSHCPLLNASVCAASVAASRAGVPFRVVAYNPLAWPRSQGLRIPLSPASPSFTFLVLDSAGKKVPAQLLPVSNATRVMQTLMASTGNLPDPVAVGTHELAFKVQVPALGYAVYTVKPSAPGQATSTTTSLRTGQATVSREVEDLTASTFTHSTVERWALGASAGASSGNVASFGNELVQLEVSRLTGNVERLRVGSGAAIELTTSVSWYVSSDEKGSEGLGSNPPSGPYIFRPNGEFAIPSPQDIVIVQGPVLTEIRQVFLDWASLVTRIWNGAEHLEVEWTAGPIPIEDNRGKELVVRYVSNVSSGDTFFTDANGREMQERRRNFRPTWPLRVTEPVSGNYYPLTAAMYIEGGGQQLAVVTERAQGGASLASGALEVMLHRRTLKEDWRGVAEPLNETMCGQQPLDQCPGLLARGTHLLSLQATASGPKHRRRLQQLANDPLVLSFGSIPQDAVQDPPRGQAWQPAMSALQDSNGLPENLHLLTLKDEGDGGVLLRLAHLFQVEEDETHLSEPVTVDLNKLLDGITFEAAEELSVSAAQYADQVQRMRWQAGESLSQSTRKAGPPEPRPQPEGSVEGGKEEDRILEQPRGLKRREQGGPLRCAGGCAASQLLVELNPMEIRTFRLTPARDRSLWQESSLPSVA